jgi:hypothetical protein
VAWESRQGEYRQRKRPLAGRESLRYVTVTMELIPGNSLLTATPEEGRALAMKLARTSVHAIQPDLETLQEGRSKYSSDPNSLIAASHVVAVEFATIAAANHYWC